ncbi:MAG: hypothetical protein R3B09_31005 [Nannocystaceae bacterium]
MTLGIDSRTDWRWLAGTYWYVPTPDLPALRLAPDGETLSWRVDQTVWHLTGYENGYFWGSTAVVMGDPDDEEPGPIAQAIAARRGPQIGYRNLLGTVTPSGRVQITFTPTGRAPIEPTVGIGQMVQRAEVWAFEMQMSMEQLRSRLLHWATMIQTRPGEPSWDRLPGIDLSVPTMLADVSPPRFADADDDG